MTFIQNYPLFGITWMSLSKKSFVFHINNLVVRDFVEKKGGGDSLLGLDSVQNGKSYT